MRKLCVSVCVLAIIAAACAAQAAVVTVTPENMESLGWSIATNEGGRNTGDAYGAFTTWGPCVYGHNGFVSEDGLPFGRGAFYAECGFKGGLTTDKTPDTVWLGVDQFNGQSLSDVTLSQIKTLDYYSFVAQEPTRIESSTGWESFKMTWHGCNSPIMLYISAVSPDGGDYKQFWLRPRSWGSGVQGPDGGMGGNIEGCWQHLNGITDRWYHAPNTSYPYTDEWTFSNWADLVAQFGDYKIMPTAPDGSILKSAGWQGNSTPSGIHESTATGKGLNFEVGARHFKGYIYYNGNALKNWYPESLGFRGQVDYFTLGIDLNGNGNDTDAGEKVTFNFEPSASEPAPQIVMGNIRGFDQEEELLRSRAGRSRFMQKIVGKITDRSGEPIWCSFEDGSNVNLMYHDGNPDLPYYESLRCYMYMDYLRAGGLPSGLGLDEYWSTWGYVERLRGYNGPGTPPLLIWSDPSHFKQFNLY